MTTTQKIKREIRRILGQIGIVKTPHNARMMSDSEIRADMAEYKRLNNDTRFVMGEENLYICKKDKYAENGVVIDSGYFIQDIWGARKVLENRPAVHYDVGSSVAGLLRIY